MDRSTALLLPDDCRVCGEPLTKFSRVPVCADCLADPEPLASEYFCSSCRTPFVNPYPLDENGQCDLCRQGLRGFDAVYTYGSYEGRLRELIHLYKFQGMRPLAGKFGGLLTRAIPREQAYDAIVPMPLHWFREWQRGFNQSELLAREVGRRWHVPVRQPLRRKKWKNPPQAGLTNAQRRKNVQGVFEAAERLDGMKILLVDDVMTTGATASACGRVLKRAGAGHVALAAIARTDRRIGLDFGAEFRGAAAVPPSERGGVQNPTVRGTHA